MQGCRHCFYSSSDTQIFIEEGFQFINNPMFFPFPVTSAEAEAGHGRHELVYAGADGGEFAIQEGAFHEGFGFFRFQVFRLDEAVQFFFLFFRHILVESICHVHGFIRRHVHFFDETVDQFFLAPKFQAGVHGLVDGTQEFLIFTVTIMVFLHQTQDVVDIHFHLPHQFHFKDDIVVDIFLFLSPGLPILIKIDVEALVVLQIPFAHRIESLKLVEGTEDIPKAQDFTKELDKFLLCGLTGNFHVHREFAPQ